MQLFIRIFYIMLFQLYFLNGVQVVAQKMSSELAYLHTDRTVYVAGESIYYKLYMLDNNTNKRSEKSIVGYIVIRAVNWASTLKVKVKIENGVSNGSIFLPDTISTGVYQILAYTREMRNNGEESFFQKEIAIVNRFDKALKFKMIETTQKDSINSIAHNLQLQINTDKNIYGTREKVTVNFNKIIAKAQVSISVFEEPKIPISYQSMLETIHKTFIKQFNTKSLNYYSPETKGKFLSGVVIDSKTQQIVKNAVVLLSCVDTVPNLQYAVTNSKGLFQFLLKDYYDAKELFLSMKDTPENSNWQIVMDDDFEQSKLWNPQLKTNYLDQNEFIKKSQNIVYINKAYQLNNENKPQNINLTTVNCPKVYSCPATTIYPKDFLSLPDFSEIAVEILPQVRIVKDNQKYSLSVFNTLTNEYNKKPPAIFLDGIYVDDISKIIKLGSDQIIKIEVVENERAFGDLVFSGIISIISKNVEIINTKPVSCSLRIMNTNTNRNGDIVAYNTNTIQNKNTPFIKQLLYWNPSVELNGIENSKFEFYTSDNLANYIIRVEGITEDGTPISSYSNVVVTNKLNIEEK